jgi:hypothetical protein
MTDLSNAVNDLLQQLTALKAAGFAVTGTFYVSKRPEQKARQSEIYYAVYPSAGERFVRVCSVAIKTPVETVLLENSPLGPTEPEKRTSVETVGIGAMPNADGIVREGSVCAVCGGTAFERRGTCLYCCACGESVGGCS